jgi:hypothetical protein
MNVRYGIVLHCRCTIVGAENLCHLGRRLAERGRFGPVFGVGRTGPDLAGGGMIFGPWA